MKTHFFLGKLCQQIFGFTLSLHWLVGYSIPSLIGFGHLLDPMKKNFFKILKNFQFATLVMLNSEFGLIWTTLTQFPNSQKFAIREIRKIPYENPFFPRQAIPTVFGFTLSLHRWYSIPRLVWFGQLLNPMKKPIFKVLFSRNSKSSIWKPKLFPSQAKQKKFLLYTVITMVILHTPFGLIWTTP